MKASPRSNAETPAASRRHFLKSTAALGVGALFSNPAAVRAATNKNSRLRIFQIGVSGIGAMQR
ncbi:MAG: twin-arginine translocation signal domain-containing protein, partial [Verrucomicrobiae bacterium]|nr:twin-arginine translocation signal domain-containing protein [Verrucomicrobiae bacterium]